MALKFCSLSSGSSGNCYLAGSDNTLVLIDAGISAKRITDGLSALGISPGDISGILITHEHSDHIKGLGVFVKKHGTPIYMNEKTAEALPSQCKYHELMDINTFDNNEPFSLGDLQVKGFPVFHDAADTVGYSVRHENSALCTVTDTGRLSDDIINEIAASDLVVLEANHDVEILKMGSYPWYLKQRILGDYGHLSNESAGRAILEAMRINPSGKQFLLAHLSKENNFPEMAYQTVINILEEKNLYAGRHLRINLLKRDTISEVYQL